MSTEQKRTFSKCVKDCMEGLVKVGSIQPCPVLLERIAGRLLKDKLNPVGRFESCFS